MTTRRLVIDSDGNGQLFLQVEGDTVSLGGSRARADTVLQQLKVVRVHCELEVEGDHVTAKSDQPGRSGEVRPGAVLQGGGFRLLLEGPAAPPAGGFAEDIGLMPEEGPGGAPAAAAPGQPAAPLRLPKRLVVIDGADQGQFFPLPEAGMVAVGKGHKYADIVLHDLYVARVHCRLEIEGDTVVVIDQAGGNGTLVNGQKITRQPMGLGDVLRVGNSSLRLEVTVPGEEFAKVAGRAGGGGGDEDAIEVVEDEGGEADFEPVEDEESLEAEVVEDDEADPLPAGASEPVRLLRLWRHKLPQLSGQALGHYRLGEVLGRGRCGVVFRAEDDKTGQAVALKVFSPQFPHGDAELKRFAGVMKGMLALRHPHLVALYSAGKTGAYTWISREYVAGESVADLLRRLAQSKKYGWRRACRVAIHVARALEFARQRHLRHGKITPANILIQETDKAAKLSDLMLGTVLDGSRLGQAVQEDRPPGELAYLAPEQAAEDAYVDELSDLYSLGAVVYALLTGRPPFLGDTPEEILEQVSGPTKVARPSAFNHDLPAPLEKVVLKMLAKRQEDRYQTPAELLADLGPIAKEEAVEV
jgi:serine/threonine-protein kinase